MAKKINGEELITPKMKHIMKGLCEPFPPDKIENRKGRSGQTWSFVASSEVINRLNEVFGCSWSVTEVESLVINSFVVKRVRLEVPDVDGTGRPAIREGWGGHAIGNDPGDSMKSAFSKALTKAASLFGVGLHLWGVSSENAGDTGDVPPWEGPNQFAGNYPNQGQMNVTVVNPGPHNQIPGGMPPNQGPPMQQAPPQLTNPNAGAGMMPPQAQPMPPQAAPMGPVPQMSNPNTGYTTGPGTPAQTQVQFQAAPPPPQAGQQYVQTGPVAQQQMAPPMMMPPPMAAQPIQGGVGIAAHQVSAIRGAATMNGFPDPMILVRQVLGAEAQALQAVEELTHDQAVRVLEYVRQTQGV